jgi:chitodextrinase
VLTRRFVVAAAVVAVAGCSLGKQTAPPLSGPSELGLSLTITATPDIITQDGASRSTIEVVARDASSQPVRGLTLRAQTIVGGVEIDYGTLSSKITSTNNDGKASFFYTAPAAPPPTVSSDAVVAIEVIPVGTNYAGAVARSVEIRLSRPGVIIPPGDAPRASFFFSPGAPRTEDDVYFDASASTGNIISYQWLFGDGDSDSSAQPTTRHNYEMAGDYNVVLTVVDDKGRANSTVPVKVTVTALAAPTAAFTFSPTSPVRNEVISFNGSLSKASEGKRIVSYTWDFGDGSPLVTTGGPIVHKAYGAARTYVAVLLVTDDAGKVGTASQNITVAP